MAGLTCHSYFDLKYCACRDEARAADLEKTKAERQAKRSEFEASKKDVKKEDDVSVVFCISTESCLSSFKVVP